MSACLLDTKGLPRVKVRTAFSQQFNRIIMFISMRYICPVLAREGLLGQNLFASYTVLRGLPGYVALCGSLLSRPADTRGYLWGEIDDDQVKVILTCTYEMYDGCTVWINAKASENAIRVMGSSFRKASVLPAMKEVNSW